MKFIALDICSSTLLFVLCERMSCYFFQEKLDDTARGIRLSGNDRFTVFAMNLAGRIVIAYPPYNPSDQCYIQYPSSTVYVYSIAAISDSNKEIRPEIFRFIEVAEDIRSENVILTIFSINKTNCNQTELSYFTVRDHEHQEYMYLKIDPTENFVYLFADWFILSFDIVKLKIHECLNMTSIISSTYRIHGVDITAEYAIVIGFFKSPIMPDTSLYIGLLFYLNPLLPISTVDLNNGNPQLTSQAMFFNRENDMSISINPRRNIALVGLPVLNKVVLLTVNATDSDATEWTIAVNRTDIAPQECTGFGRSVAWVDDETVAISVLTVPNAVWSQSSVWIYPVDDYFTIPKFAFPNNQQQILFTSQPLFLQMFVWSGNLIVFTEARLVMMIPTGLAGHVSVWNIYNTNNILVFKSIPCLSGTYKDKGSFGPCELCPAQTKNPGDEPCTECQRCLEESFCPSGSINDLSLSSYPSYTQTYTYPDPPDMNNYDDLLVQNIFTIDHLRRCTYKSPLLWAIVAIVFCFSVWLIMKLSELFCCPEGQVTIRTRAKQFLKKADIVNEGERWIGGLFSIAIFLLFGFTFWFSSQFLKLYPIENSAALDASCDNTIRNAIFDNALQLPLPNTDGKQWDIFPMLDNQQFTMTLDLLNTGADCSSITVQQNRPGVKHLNLQKNTICLIQPDKLTTTIRFLLPAHRTNVQVNVTGPYFIGGMRLCLKGPGDRHGVHSLETLDICQLFSTASETLSRFTTLNIVLIKVINVTKPLQIGTETYYHGRWAPTFAESSLSDKLIYEQDGSYLRYISPRTIISITLNEQPFFLQNNQQPMVRQAELAFHTLLFCILIIELFGMAFLLFRLIIRPIIKFILRHRNQNKNQSKKNENIEEKSRPISPIQIADLQETMVITPIN